MWNLWQMCAALVVAKVVYRLLSFAYHYWQGCHSQAIWKHAFEIKRHLEKCGCDPHQRKCRLGFERQVRDFQMVSKLLD